MKSIFSKLASKFGSINSILPIFNVRTPGLNCSFLITTRVKSFSQRMTVYLQLLACDKNKILKRLLLIEVIIDKAVEQSLFTCETKNIFKD